MRQFKLVVWLSSVIIVLALIAASLGLFWQDEGNLFSFITLRGDTVSIAGRGLYRYDTTLIAMGFKAGDAVTLILGIPALYRVRGFFCDPDTVCNLVYVGTFS